MLGKYIIRIKGRYSGNLAITDEEGSCYPIIDCYNEDLFKVYE